MTQPPTIITLTLPTPSDGGIPLENSTATLLIQRGSLAHVRQFTCVVMEDLTTAIHAAFSALAEVEAAPPVIPDAPPESPKSGFTTSKSPTKPTEPMFTILVGKKTVNVPVRNLQLVQMDEAAQEQAVQIASKLIGGGLWDGQSPIYIADTTRTLKKMKHLSDKEMKLFSLTDFVDMGATSEAAVVEAAETSGDNETAPTLRIGDSVHIREGATDTDGEPVPFTEGIIEEFDYDSGSPRAWISTGDNDVWVSVHDIVPVRVTSTE